MEPSGLIIKITLFLLWLNFLPPLAYLIWEKKYSYPLDGNTTFLDGKYIFGPHKTIRGTLFCLAGSTLFVPVMKIGWLPIITSACLVLFGDLSTSFLKRRFGYPSGTQIIVLDQFAESVLPILYLCRYIPASTQHTFLSLSWPQLSTILLLFVTTAFLGSLVWKKAIYKTPEEDSLRIVKGTTRPKKWRAFHQPAARYHTFFNFENFILYRIIITSIFKMTGLYQQGVQNALNITIRRDSFSFPHLPREFDGLRIMLITDLHLDGIPELTDKIIKKIETIEVDLCLIGGDIRMEVYGSATSAMRKMRRLVRHIKSKHGIFGVLGNHDCIEMVPDLEEAGVTMLVNDSWKIQKENTYISIAGIDDPHFYKVHDLPKAFKAIPAGTFCILLSHSPEAYLEACRHNPALYLCGHTHGGQIKLPGCPPLYTNSKAPRFTSEGLWEYNGMQGFTSRGVGVSGVPLRYNCPGEVNILTIYKGSNNMKQDTVVC